MSDSTMKSTFGASSRARRVFFTLNNPEALLDWPQLQAEGATLLVYQKEKGDQEETPHFQGVVCFDKQMRLAALKKLPGLDKAHFEVVKSLPAALAYCKKEDTRVDGPWEYGTAPAQGKRNDLLAVKAALDDGASLSTIAQDFFAEFVRHRKAFTDYKRVVTCPRDFKTVVICLVGPSGIGKSRTANILASALSGSSIYYASQPKGSGWYFDDYMGEETILVDEFDGNFCTPTFFNQFVDRYPMTLPVHGSAGHQMASRYVIITTNYLPKFWWKKRSPGQVVQTTRRIEFLWPMLDSSQRGVRAFPCLVNGQPGNVLDVEPYAASSKRIRLDPVGDEEVPYFIPLSDSQLNDELSGLFPSN